MIDITMPALSPTMETGTLAKWLVAVGDAVKSGDVLCEIETDKATMEVESIDEGVVAELLVAEGTEEIPVGQVILRLTGEGEEVAKAAPSAPLPEREGPGVGSPAPAKAATPVASVAVPVAAAPTPLPAQPAAESPSPARGEGSARINASPLARRIAQAQGVNLAGIAGSGPNGRIVKADLDGAHSAPVAKSPAAAAPGGEQKAAAPAPKPVVADPGIPHELVKLSNMRKTIARRLTESKQQVPHIYLTVDVRLDALLKLRGELNATLESRGIKLSVNDMLIKALAQALMQVPACNVSFAGDNLITYSRADISVAVSIPTGLITPIIFDAANKALSSISTSMKALADKAKAGKLQPAEFQGGTASLSNMGMYGIKQFEAVINPPQGMIMAIGAGEKRPYVVDDALAVATVMSATGSFDHRAIDGADGAQLMKAFKELVESPLGLVA
jgi:pyruvate dehydrogenase E2 component (dihydrolipoamide acetyltransferase)